MGKDIWDKRDKGKRMRSLTERVGLEVKISATCKRQEKLERLTDQNGWRNLHSLE